MEFDNVSIIFTNRLSFLLQLSVKYFIDEKDRKKCLFAIYLSGQWLSSASYLTVWRGSSASSSDTLMMWSKQGAGRGHSAHGPCLFGPLLMDFSEE